MLGLLVVAAAAAMAVAWAFPWQWGLALVISFLVGLPCLFVMLVFQLMLFSRMMPWSEPGGGLRLYRAATDVAEDRDSGNDDP